VTEEAVSAYVASLDAEKSGYEARLARLAVGKSDPLDEEALSARLAAVDAELSRLAQKPKKSGKKGA